MPRNYQKVERQIKICAMCKRPFETARENQRFCSSEHRLEFVRSVTELGRCPHCKGELI